jgi:hypothetical protein
MIDPISEALISFAEAARMVPRRRGGRGTHISTIYRWATLGIRGVVLESLQCGGGRATSREAMARFFARLTDVASTGPVGAHPDAPPTRRTAARRRRDSERAGERLAELGA